MRTVVTWLSWLLPQGLANWLLRRVARVGKEFFSANPQEFVDLLLEGMTWAFCLCRPFRRNLRGFHATYGFMTQDGAVAETVHFADGKMTRQKGLVPPQTVRVTFLTAKALQGFLFSGNQDILQPMLANEVAVEGNLNYVYKFAFMARDLVDRLGIEL